MQRFTRAYLAAQNLNSPQYKQERYQAFLRCGDNYCKFKYGANGTLTQAARWRADAFKTMAKRREMFDENVYISDLAPMTIAIRSYLDSAQRGGCRLP